MLYPFMTLPDGTEIVHSESIVSGDRETVKVCVETPVDYGFKSATCWLPEYRWEDVDGYDEADIQRLEQILRNNAHLIMEFSRSGGVLNAAGA